MRKRKAPPSSSLLPVSKKKGWFRRGKSAKSISGGGRGTFSNERTSSASSSGNGKGLFSRKSKQPSLSPPRSGRKFFGLKKDGQDPKLPSPEHRRSRTIDPKKLRLSVLALVVIGCFVALYSRLWYLQVLAVDELKAVAQDNRVRTVEYEPPRGRILDRWGNVLVENKRSLAVSLERDLLENPVMKNVVIARLSQKLNVPLSEMYDLLEDQSVSPYRPIPVAYDVPEQKAIYIEEHSDAFPGVVIEKVWKRHVVRGNVAPHVLGYTNEISEDELKDPDWKGYQPGDIIGKSGVERSMDEALRGEPRVERVVVDSTGDPIGPPRVIKEEEAGVDVRLTISPRIQRVTQGAITNGVLAAQAAGKQGCSGAAVVMDPNNGDVLAMASFPTYDAKIVANGYTDREAKELGATTDTHCDDELTNRPLSAPLPPGSTFKAITTAAALELNQVEPYEYIPCPGTFVPPGTGTPFFNWTTSDLPSMDIPHALEISCNTVFFDLGWRMEDEWGIPPVGDGQMFFQRYVRNMGFGHPTGIELPEHPGLVPDPRMCDLPGYCPDGDYQPGYTVNMAVGQGDLLTTPMQMAVAYGALANGGQVLEPRVVKELTRETEGGKTEVVREFPVVVKHELGLDETELSVIRQGLWAVVNGGVGTANDAFVGLGVDVAGKTGTAQVGSAELDISHSWFISYAPASDPQYVVAVYVEYGGLGGETAAPVAREIYEGIFNRDYNTAVDIISGGHD